MAIDLVVYIVFLYFIFRIGAGADTAWYRCTHSFPDNGPFRYGGMSL